MSDALNRSHCPAVVSIEGEAFTCDLDAPHRGLAHANKRAQALWLSGDEKEWHDRIEWASHD